MNVTNRNNFCRVFELPDEYSGEFCFGGGIPIVFKMVDWFNPIPVEDMVEGPIKTWKEYVPLLKKRLRQKNYVEPGKKFILITDFNESLVFWEAL